MICVLFLSTEEPVALYDEQAAESLRHRIRVLENDIEVSFLSAVNFLVVRLKLVHRAVIHFSVWLRCLLLFVFAVLI